MAKAEGGLGDGLRGNIDGLSFYKMRGVKKTVVRRSSGHTKEKIKSDPELAAFKRAGEEFAGRVLMSKFLMGALIHQKPLADYNIAGPFTALVRPIQKLDLVSRNGKRAIHLSQQMHYLKGFSLNENHPFDSVIRFPVSATVSRETLSAKVLIPELIPDINFMPPVRHPYYSIRISIAVVPDIIYDKNRYAPVHRDYPEICSDHVDTQWFSLQEGSGALEVDIQSGIIPPDTNFTLVLAVGIRYGELKTLNHIAQVPRAGSAKVLEVG